MTAGRMTGPFIACCRNGDTLGSTRPLFKTPTIHAPCSSAGDGAASAPQRCSSDGNSGHGIGFVARARMRLGSVGTRSGKDAGDSREDAGNGIDEYHHPADTDA